MTDEAIITINGNVLTIAQSITLRVALASFSSAIKIEGLGDDDHGKTMTNRYLSVCREIEDMMIPSPKEK